jgi:hypothetical protein
MSRLVFSKYLDCVWNVERGFYNNRLMDFLEREIVLTAEQLNTHITYKIIWTVYRVVLMYVFNCFM